MPLPGAALDGWELTSRRGERSLDLDLGEGEGSLANETRPMAMASSLAGMATEVGKCEAWIRAWVCALLSPARDPRDKETETDGVAY